MRHSSRLAVRLASILILAIVAATALPAQTELTVRGVESSDPFTVAATATDERLTIAIEMRAGWHMYGKDVGGGDPVSVAMAKGSCLVAAGALRIPATADGKLTGKFELVLPLRRARAGGELTATFSLMTCDALMCLPPKDLILSTLELGAAAGDRLKVLLVTLDDAVRSARIKAFLVERGFDCTIGRYDGLTIETCDRFDLIVADSPNADQKTSRAAMKQRGFAVQFPRTKTPIIAVGYLGTVLLEAHEIAAACGYI